MAMLIDTLLSEPVRSLRPGRVQRAKLRQVLMSLLTNLLEAGPAAGDRAD
jgi:hypothetical protein